MIKKIISFDFDGTLIYTPTPEIGRPQWEKETGLAWAGRGWWGSAESLNTNVFHPPVNPWVFNQFEKYQADDENYVFIATGRLSRLEKQVRSVLALHDIDCDLYCNTGGDTYNFKCHLFETLIRNNPYAEEIILFDDRHEHLVKFVEWAKMQPINVVIIDVINKITHTQVNK
jgi:hypothetical protein